jgi:hypothetical protein
MTEDSVIAPADTSIDEVEAGATNSTDDVFPTEASVNPRKRFGRNPSAIWTFFTDSPNPHKLESAKCKHCNMVINHHTVNR